MALPTSRRTALAAPLLLLALTGCGDDDPGGTTSPPEAQPAPGVSVFAEGDFDGIPVPPRSVAVGERSEDDGVVAQSYEVRNVTPADLMAFYDEALGDDHDVLEAPEEIGVGTVRAVWDVDGRALTIVAQEAPTLDDNPGAPEVVTQLSLSLAPSG